MRSIDPSVYRLHGHLGVIRTSRNVLGPDGTELTNESDVRAHWLAEPHTASETRPTVFSSFKV